MLARYDKHRLQGVYLELMATRKKADSMCDQVQKGLLTGLACHFRTVSSK